MRNIFIALIIVGCLILQACSAEPISKIATDNNEIRLELLFNTDGCRIYRFSSDFSRYNYFARCTGANTASVSGLKSCGKNCSRVVTTPTITEP